MNGVELSLVAVNDAAVSQLSKCLSKGLTVVGKRRIVRPVEAAVYTGVKTMMSQQLRRAW